MIVTVTIRPEGSGPPVPDRDVRYMHATLVDYGMTDVTVGADLAATMQVEASSLREGSYLAGRAYGLGLPV